LFTFTYTKLGTTSTSIGLAIVTVAISDAEVSKFEVTLIVISGGFGTVSGAV